MCVFGREFVFLFFSSFIRVLLYLPPCNPSQSLPLFTSISTSTQRQFGAKSHLPFGTRILNYSSARVQHEHKSRKMKCGIVCTVHESMASMDWHGRWSAWRAALMGDGGGRGQQKKRLLDTTTTATRTTEQKKTTCHVYDFYAFTLTTKCN